MWLVGLAFLILLSRAYALQILRGEELSLKGRRNFAQRVRVPHDRGIIYDRLGRILVDNRQSLDLQITKAFLGTNEEAEATLREVAGLVGMSEEELQWARETLAGKPHAERFEPIVIKRDLTPEQVEVIEAERSMLRLDGVEIAEWRRRTYPHGTLAGHLLGYVNEISRGELDAARRKGNPRHYVLGDIVGRDGIERAYEEALRGVDGHAFVVKNAKGRRVQAAYVAELLLDYPAVEPKPGHNVFLTIDLELQRHAEAAFDGRAGAIVAIDPRTGDVLALVSVPEFDPNLVSGLLGKEEKERLDADPLKPWVNRTIQGQYAPGSTFKAITATAALAYGKAEPRDAVFCPGWYRMGRQRWRCHKESGHGRVNLHDAIKKSCDTYFYTMGERLGINNLAEVSRFFGLGRRTGIPLRNEQPGLVPDEAFHDRVDAATGGYQRGMVINTAIGQGSLLVTPLQLALAYATVANRGTLFKPQVVERIETADFRVVRRFLPELSSAAARDEETEPLVAEEVAGDVPVVLERFEPEVAGELSVGPEVLDAVHDGLVAVTGEPGGTAWWRRSRKVSMAGKTGTAQVVRLGRDRRKADEMAYEERDHAWFVTYAPADDPEIVVAVLNEHSGHGSSHAAPIATKVVDAYFDLEQERLAQSATEEAGDGP
jgi:penicillin-binding protein 2